VRENSELAVIMVIVFYLTVADLRKLMEAVPEDPGEQDMLRLRGESRALIEERIGNAQGMADDLFSSL